MLLLFREKWRGEVVLGRQELDVVRVLGMGGFLRVEKLMERSVEEEDTLEETEQSESEQDTERGVEGVIKDSNPLEERKCSQYELDQGTQQFENSITEIDKLIGDGMPDEDKGDEYPDFSAKEENTCSQCGTTTTEMLLHIAEVHLEEELGEEMLRIFPGGCAKCMKCGKTFNNRYEKKEHTSLLHP